VRLWGYEEKPATIRQKGLRDYPSERKSENPSTRSCRDAAGRSRNGNVKRCGWGKKGAEGDSSYSAIKKGQRQRLSRDVIKTACEGQKWHAETTFYQTRLQPEKRNTERDDRWGKKRSYGPHCKEGRRTGREQVNQGRRTTARQWGTGQERKSADLFTVRTRDILTEN